MYVCRPVFTTFFSCVLSTWKQSGFENRSFTTLSGSKTLRPLSVRQDKGHNLGGLPLVSGPYSGETSREGDRQTK